MDLLYTINEGFYIDTTKHVEDAQRCGKCFVSTRAKCPVCGHSLTGEIVNRQSECEFCHSEIRDVA